MADCRELLKYVENFERVRLVGPDLELLASELGPKATVRGRTSPENKFASYEDDHFDAVVCNNVLKSWDLLDQNALQAFLRNGCKILKDGGIMLIGENFSHDPNSMPYYTSFFDLYRSENHSGFKLCWLKCLDVSIENSENWRDFCWCLQKSNFSNDVKDGVVSLRDFLDKSQYDQQGIEAYEWIYGKGFISPGGLDENRKFLSMLAPKSGQLMLDVGCGIGGGVAQAAREFGLKVLGVDVSSNMLNTAINRTHEVKDKQVRYMLTDIMEHDFPPNHFDFVYSKDTIVHIKDKEEMFRRFYKWLKPGGKILVIGVTTGPGKRTAAFQSYLDSRQYTMLSASVHAEACKKVGFENVVATDMAQRLNEFLHIEISNSEKKKEEFLKKFTPEQYDKLLEGWRDKVGFVATENLSWMLLEAEKPSQN